MLGLSTRDATAAAAMIHAEYNVATTAQPAHARGHHTSQRLPVITAIAWWGAHVAIGVGIVTVTILDDSALGRCGLDF